MVMVNGEVLFLNNQNCSSFWPFGFFIYAGLALCWFVYPFFSFCETVALIIWK